MHLVPYEIGPIIKVLLQKEKHVSFPLISAVLLGSQNGKIFVDNIDRPKIIFILTNFGFSQYFLLQNVALTESFINFLNESTDLPFYFHVYDYTTLLGDFLQPKGLDLKLRERQQLRYLSKNLIKVNIAPIGYSLLNMDQIEFEKFEPLNLDLNKRFWPSAEDFMNNAYGKCIVDVSNMPVSVCYSACIADGVSEIDIATLPEYQGKGFGKIVTQAFINESVSRGLQANWDCFSENISSLEVAKQTAFEVVKKYTFLSIYNKLKHEKERS